MNPVFIDTAINNRASSGSLCEADAGEATAGYEVAPVLTVGSS